jgi:hypothetical protein
MVRSVELPVVVELISFYMVSFEVLLVRFVVLFIVCDDELVFLAVPFVVFFVTKKANPS